MREVLEQVIAASPVCLLPERYLIAQVAGLVAPEGVFAVIRDELETTVIAAESDARCVAAVSEQKWFRALAIDVAAPFQAPGFVAAATTALADAAIDVYVVSTFSRDYIIVREADAEKAMEALMLRGFSAAKDDR